MSTPEQHLALFLEILAEMTPEQVAKLLVEASQPLKLDPITFDFTDEPSFAAKRLDYLYGHAMVINPYLISTNF